MSPLVAYHTSMIRCRRSIMRRGLLCSRPKGGRPTGVYVYSDSILHHVASSHATFWDSSHGQDIWQVSYIGPVINDKYVANAFILMDSVPPNQIRLVQNGQ